MFFVETFQGTKNSLWRLRQKISCLGKAPSFLRAVYLPSSCKPTLTANYSIFYRKSRSWDAQPKTQRSRPERSPPGSGQTRVPSQSLEEETDSPEF